MSVGYSTDYSTGENIAGPRYLHTALPLLGAACLLSLVSPTDAFAFESAKFAIKEICSHLQGDLGALLMTTAGVGAIVAAAFGNFRASHSLIITAIGGLTVSAMLSLYFGGAAELCSQGANGATARTIGANLTRTTGPAGLATTARTNNPLADTGGTAGGLGAAELAIAAGGEADFSGAAQFNTDEEPLDEFEQGLLDFDQDFQEDADLF